MYKASEHFTPFTTSNKITTWASVIGLLVAVAIPGVAFIKQEVARQRAESSNARIMTAAHEALHLEGAPLTEERIRDLKGEIAESITQQRAEAEDATFSLLAIILDPVSQIPAVCVTSTVPVNVSGATAATGDGHCNSRFMEAISTAVPVPGWTR